MRQNMRLCYRNLCLKYLRKILNICGNILDQKLVIGKNLQTEKIAIKVENT